VERRRQRQMCIRDRFVAGHWDVKAARILTQE
jgi:hypothetical protein